MMETHVLGLFFGAAGWWWVFVADFGGRNLRGARERWGWDGVHCADGDVDV